VSAVRRTDRKDLSPPRLTPTAAGFIWAAAAVFTKSGGGTIYGSNESTISLRNNVTSGATRGYAAYAAGSPAKYRDTSAGTTVNLDASNTANWNQ